MHNSLPIKYGDTEKEDLLEMTTREVKGQVVVSPPPPPDRTKAVESDATPVKSGRPKMHKFTPRLQGQETPHIIHIEFLRSKGIPRQAEVGLGVPGRLRLRIISTFGTTRVVGRQPNAPAAFTPGEIPGTHFQKLSRPQGTWFCRKGPRKKSQVTPPGIDPTTVRLVVQRLNHYATPGPGTQRYHCDFEGQWP